MAAVWGILARTVYASMDNSQPLYLHQLFTICDFPNASVYIPPEQVARAGDLRAAVAMALKEAERQADNPLY